MMQRTSSPLFGLSGLALLALAAACSGSSSTSETTSALTAAQCTFLANHAAAEACRHAFEACLADGGTAATTCRSTLEACLPPPPDGGLEGFGHRGGPHGGAPPPFLDGGLPPFGEGHGHGPGGPGCGADGGLPPVGEGPGPHGPVLVQPDPTAIAACHTALATCLTANPLDPGCFQTAHSCERSAFAAAFAAACAAAQPCTVSSDPACTGLLERCQEGVDGNPGAFDGGTCP